MRSLLVAAAVLIGELVPKFDLVMGVIGGTLTGPLVFVLPPLFYAKISRLEVAFDAEIARIRRDRSTIDDDSEETSTSASVGQDDNSCGRSSSYGTFQRATGRTARIRAWRSDCWARLRRVGQTLCGEFALAIAVIGFGLAATVASTYFSALHVHSLQEFWSPCIHNITYSFASL